MPKAKKTSYYDYLRQEMGELIDQLQIPDLQKQSLKHRWLDQVVWADKKADQCRRWHYRLRLTTIVGGVVLPALVGINFQLGKDNEFFRNWFPYVPFALSQIIAVSAAAEEFFRYGDRWRDYRRLSEDLKAEGWQFLQLSGPYQYKGDDAFDVPLLLPVSQISTLKLQDWQALKPSSTTKKLTTHQESFTLFASRVESLIKQDVQSYITALQQKQAKENQQVQQILGTAQSVATDKTLFAQPEPPVTPNASSYGNGYAVHTGNGATTYAPVSDSSGHASMMSPPQFSSPPPPPQLTSPPPVTQFVAPPDPSIAPVPAAFSAPPPAPVPPPTAATNLNQAILAAANKLRGMSTAEGPDGGNNACAWTVNKVLHEAGIAPLGDNPNYVPSVLNALQAGRGQQISREVAKAGDLVIATGEAHIGIGLTDGCTRVLSNSSSHACFQWESDIDFDDSYGGASTIYRLIS